MTIHRIPSRLPRFWSARDAQLELDRHGFLIDPTREFLGVSSNDSALSADHIRSTRALVLLGEPGSGKSTALGMAHDGSTDHRSLLPAAFTGEVWALQLGDCRSESRLAEVLDGKRIQDWIASDTELALLLDSFDECQAGVENLRRMLALRLAKWPTERLVLRVTCRTAEWPEALESRLKASFGDELRVYEIAPLRATDAAEIARSAGLDEERFLRSVRDRGVGVLAARPLLLRMLIAEATGGDLPTEPLELYRRGVVKLTAEHDELRADDHTRPEPDEALAAARFLAACAIFGARATFVLADDVGEDGDLSIRHLVLIQPAGHGSAPLTRAQVTSVLGAGLFTSRGPGRFGFAHYSFGEYLAAEWIVWAQLAERQVRQLLLASDGGVVPMLRNVAVWLAAIDPDQFGWTIEAEPEIVFGEAIDVPSSHLRQLVTRRLFDEARAQPWHRHDYACLAHPELANTLRENLLSDDDDHTLLACLIAADCELIELLDDLAAIACSEKTPLRTRIRAALAVNRIARDRPTACLLPLVATNLPEDQVDELRGIALDTSWPHAIQFETVLSLVAEPRQPNLLGLYWHFLNYSLPQSLMPHHLDQALEWLCRREESGRGAAFDRFADAIVRLACEHADPERDRILAVILWNRAGDGEGLLVDSIRDRPGDDPLVDDVRRRQLISALFDVISDQSQHQRLFGLIGEGAPCRSTDFAWLSEQISVLAEPLRSSALALAAEAFRPDDRDQVELLLSFRDDHPIRERLAHWLGSCPIDDPRGEAWRDRWRPEPAPSDEEIEAMILDDLEQVEGGDNLAFVHANGLTAADDRGLIQLFANARVVGRPRWSRLSDETRARFIDAAEAYLRMPVLQAREPLIAGANALLLLTELRPEALDRPKLWQTWAAGVVELIRWGEHDDDAITTLLDLATSNAGPAIQDAICAGIEAVGPESYYFPFRLARGVWDERFTGLLLPLVDRLNGAAYDNLLDLLAEHAIDETRDLLTSQLRGTDHDLRLAAARRLLIRGGAEDWQFVLAQLHDDKTFGRELIESVAGRIRYSGTPGIDADLLEAFFGWLTEQYPPSEDPAITEVHAIGPREQIADWRDSLLAELATRGDDPSVAALRRLRDRFPDRNLIGIHLREALEHRRRNQYRPVTPEELVVLRSMPAKTLVRSAADLRDLVLQTLEDIERTYLQGEEAQAATLWNEHPALRPKSEEAITAVVARLINDRLDGLSATALREVAGRRVSPTGMPERSDLIVRAIAEDRVVTVIIECKGCWNRELDTAMKTQLVDRYLADWPTAEGIYLAYWFDPGPWASVGDQRRARCTKESKESVLARLDSQAADLRAQGARVTAAVLDGSWSHPTRSEAQQRRPES